MQHVAIDLGGRESQLCVRGDDGQILLEQKVATRSGGYGECEPGCKVGACCGDGTVQEGEDCDDGNRFDGDGCGSACRHVVVK